MEPSTELVLIDRSLTIQRIIDEISAYYVVPFTPFFGADFVLMHDNAKPISRDTSVNTLAYENPTGGHVLQTQILQNMFKARQEDVLELIQQHLGYCSFKTRIHNIIFGIVYKEVLCQYAIKIVHDKHHCVNSSFFTLQPTYQSIILNFVCHGCEALSPSYTNPSYTKSPILFI